MLDSGAWLVIIIIMQFDGFTSHFLTEHSSFFLHGVCGKKYFFYDRKNCQVETGDKAVVCHWPTLVFTVLIQVRVNLWPGALGVSSSFTCWLVPEEDPNAEPLHWLEVAHLKRTVYATPFALPPGMSTARSAAEWWLD